MRDIEPGEVFKEMEPIEQWSSLIDLDMTAERLRNEITNTAIELRQNFHGFIELDLKEKGQAVTYTRMRYPRRKLGVLSITECDEGMGYLAGGLNVPAKAQVIEGNIFRAVIGLRESRKDKKAPAHKIDKVKEELGDDFLVVAAEAFYVVHDNESYRPSDAPVAIIYGDMPDVRKVYDLAVSLEQARFTIEDFGSSTAQLVETRHCYDRDEE